MKLRCVSQFCFVLALLNFLFIICYVEASEQSVTNMNEIVPNMNVFH